jgi:hypothetical protein
MKFLSNTYNPRLSEAKWYVLRQKDETQEEAWRRQQQWLIDKII